MAADIFEQLLAGDTAGDNAAVAAQLRRQNMLGQMAQLSGDRVLSPLGARTSQNALQTAEGISDRRDRAGQRAAETDWRKAQQLNSDRQYQMALDQMAQNEQFRRDQLQQTAYDRDAGRQVSMANAMEAANARKAASATNNEKIAREMRQDSSKNKSVMGLIDSGIGILEGKAAPGTDPLSRGGRALAGFFGYGTEGAKSQGELESIGALLVQNMPKMGGSMSDSDVRLYQAAAGKLSDPSTPNNVKVSSLQQLKDVVARNQKYFDSELATLQGQRVPGTNGPWAGDAGGGSGLGIRTFNPATGKLE